MDEPLIEAKGLKKHFLAEKKTFIDSITKARLPVVKAVDGVDLAITEGEVVALVGESGSGKTTLGRLLVSLESPTGGDIYFQGNKLDNKSMGDLRKNVQMVFQNPADSLDPRMPIRGIVTEALSGMGLTREETEDRFRRALSLVGLDPGTFAERRARDLSGGQKQRIAVARAIIANPKFVVLDEPTSALDASVQGQVLNLLSDLQGKLKLTYLLITHNIGVARYISTRTAVMYAGKITELGPTKEILNHPKHPYTAALFQAVPDIRRKQLIPPVGEVPSLVDLPVGCRYNTRCPLVKEKCRVSEPPLIVSGKVEVACWLYE